MFIYLFPIYYQDIISYHIIPIIICHKSPKTSTHHPELPHSRVSHHSTARGVGALRSHGQFPVWWCAWNNMLLNPYCFFPLATNQSMKLRIQGLHGSLNCCVHTFCLSPSFFGADPQVDCPTRTLATSNATLLKHGGPGNPRPWASENHRGKIMGEPPQCDWPEGSE